MWFNSFLILNFLLPVSDVFSQSPVAPLTSPAKISTFDFLGTGKQKIVNITLEGKSLSLFIFISPECPLCQNYSLTINHLQERFGKQLNVYGIIPGKAYSVDDAISFEKKYHTVFKILIDSDLKFTHYLKAGITPQAILIDNNGNLVYNGAVDDWVKELGKKKIKATKHYVADAIEQSLGQQPVKIWKTKPFGCRINDY